MWEAFGYPTPEQRKLQPSGAAAKVLKHNRAVRAIKAYFCPLCFKTTTKHRGWYRCPDGEIGGNPIEFKVKWDRILYRYCEF